MHLSIPAWPENERPREKLLHQGAEQLSDAELLAIFLRTGIKGKTAVDLAREILNTFGSLRHLLEADLNEFCQIKGLGPAKFIQLQAVLELSKRYLQKELEQASAFTSVEQTTQFLSHKLRHQPQEVFVCLFLNSQHKLLRYEEIFYGTVNSAVVHPRVIVQKSMKYNAAAVIFAHNHPSGISDPSESDKLITRDLIKALALIDVKVLDHIIIGDVRHFSFANAGLLST